MDAIDKSPIEAAASADPAFKAAVTSDLICSAIANAPPL